MDLVYRLEVDAASGIVRRLCTDSVTSMYPMFVYDGDCAFCKFWLSRWQRHTQGSVIYEPYQKVKSQFSHIAEQDFARAAKLVAPDGRVFSGAAAVFRLWTYRSRPGRLWWWSYRHVPLFAPFTELVYRTVARNRPLLWKLTRRAFPYSTRPYEDG